MEKNTTISSIYKMDNAWVEEVELELTSSCNLDCPLCARNYENNAHLLSGGQRPYNDLIDQLDSYTNLKRCCLAGIISEPTLYKHFFDLIEYLKSRDITIELYTNGNTHNELWWEELGKLCDESIKVIFTVCGSNQALHEKYRKNSDLKQLLNHHSSFKKYSKSDYLQHITFTYNQEDFKNMGYIRSLFTNECNIHSMPYRSRFPLKIKIDEDIDIIPELKKQYETISKIGNLKLQNKCNINCKSFETRFISIDNKGHIAPCFLHRYYINKSWDLDYTEIKQGLFDMCYECEKSTQRLLELNNLERMA
ncbi:MAG: radical SAM protein [Sphaerochaeta sp.]